MKRKISFILGVISLITILFIGQPKCIYAENNVAQLTLHAYGDALPGSNGDLGHTFLSIKNTTNSTLDFLGYPIYPKKVISVSIWPDRMSPFNAGGVYINREMVVCRNKTVTTSVTIDITLQQLNRIITKSPKESYYHDGQNDPVINLVDDGWHNCTTYSVKMWNLVAPKKYKITDGFLGIDAPKWVASKIRKMSGYQEVIFETPQKLDFNDVFYVTKSKELIPFTLKTPYFISSIVSKNTISLKWGSSKKNYYYYTSLQLYK